MIDHLALIMDGNRRWAKKNALVAWLGHEQGAKNVEMSIQYCLDKKIPYLSLYTLSLENLNRRSQQELSFLFSLLKKAQERVQEFVKAGVKIRFVGNLSLVSADIANVCFDIEQKTQNGHLLTCNFLFCYGSQQEILNAVQAMVQQNIPVTLESFRQNLWSGNIPDPNIIIRTGGVYRLSNFLLFQAAYSEIRFLDCLWPDLTYELLDQTVQHCLNAQKNFGL